MSGRFVWHDLVTTDTEAAIAFYSKVAGYETEAFTDSPAPTPYRMWVNAAGPLGGVMPCPEACREPFWTGYVDVENLDATLERATRLGGKTLIPATPIPGVGRFAMIQDPQAASLSLLEPAPGESRPPRDPTKPTPGDIVWNELSVPDAKKALAFHGELFGWSLAEEMPMGAHGTYLIYAKDGVMLGGMLSDPSSRSSWLFYIEVANLDAAIAQATALQAVKHHGPTPVPGGARIAVMSDPQGVRFGLVGK